MGQTINGELVIVNGGVLMDGGVIAGGEITTEANVAASGDISTAGNFRVDGNAAVGRDAEVTGTLRVGVDIVLLGQDCAEDFATGEDSDLQPGSVVIVDGTGMVRQSDEPYDARVVGVVSGAAPYRPGIILGRGVDDAPCSPVALIGRAVCRVDASYAPIACGDLLTTSGTPGYAMKATDRDRAFGATFGKALQALDSGIGTIPILVGLR